jgi:hypothetical protein
MYLIIVGACSIVFYICCYYYTYSRCTVISHNNDNDGVYLQQLVRLCTPYNYLVPLLTMLHTSLNSLTSLRYMPYETFTVLLSHTDITNTVIDAQYANINDIIKVRAISSRLYNIELQPLRMTLFWWCINQAYTLFHIHSSPHSKKHII